MQKCGKGLIFSLLALSAIISCVPAQATTHRSHRTRLHHIRHTRYRNVHHAHVIQCVAFVHQSTDFQIHGNAREWWGKAKGLYARGTTPEEGSVLSFRPTRHMPLGHVAVVRSVIDSRSILIDQAHWGSNGITHDIRVVDVSADNDWSEVRVALGSHSDRLGSIYPTHGFIYARPENNDNKSPTLFVASNTLSSEMASAPDVEESIFNTDAPNRALR